MCVSVIIQKVFRKMGREQYMKMLYRPFNVTSQRHFLQLVDKPSMQFVTSLISNKTEYHGDTKGTMHLFILPIKSLH